MTPESVNPFAVTTPRDTALWAEPSPEISASAPAGTWGTTSTAGSVSTPGSTVACGGTASTH